jgi:hypothetical protein
VPDASSDSRSQYVEPAISAGANTDRRSEAIPLSAFETDSTGRIPYGTRTAAEISNTRTTVGTSAAPDPEKKVTLHNRCCSSRQTVRIAISLTHVAKSAENARMQYRSRVLDADNAEKSRGISVKRRKNGMAPSSQKVYQLDKKAIEWRSRMDMVHEMRILVGAKMTTRVPKLTDTPKRMNWYKVTPLKS